MKNQEIAKVFAVIADMLEIKGDNPFRIRAYRRAAQNIDGLAKDVATLQEDDLQKIPGIGHDLAGKIREYVDTGHVSFYDELKREVPSGIVEMLSVPGIGPKTVRLFFDRYNIRNINDLERSAKQGRLRGLPGIQAKTEENILRGIAMVKRRSGRQPLGRILPIAEEITKNLQDNAPVREIAIAGSIRRWKDTIRDIDILATSGEPKRVMKVLAGLPLVKEVLMTGPTKSSVITQEGTQVDVRVVEETSFGAALAYFTGSKAHNIRLREMAVRMGLKLNEYGVYETKSGKKIGGKNEGDIYRALHLQYIPPELREDSGEIEAAAKKSLPALVEQRDVKGDLHVHTDSSDGTHSIEELVHAARKLGYEYIAITDHSKGLGVARGMGIEKALQQNERIAAMNKRLRGFRVLSGIEMDIRSDGSMDYPDEVLKRFDIVVASLHSGFRQSKEQLTGRLISAMRNPYVSVIAHPTGRLIGERDAYEIDMEKFLMTAMDTRTAVEINAYPLRLDLNDVNSRKAKETGVHLVISTDTHVIYQFDLMKYGIRTARRGWLEAGDIVNTYPCRALLKQLSAKRTGNMNV